MSATCASHWREAGGLLCLSLSWTAFGALWFTVSAWLLYQSDGSEYVLLTPTVIFVFRVLLMASVVFGVVGLGGLVLLAAGVLDRPRSLSPLPDPIPTVDVRDLRRLTGFPTLLIYWNQPAYVAVDARLARTPVRRAWAVWAEAVTFRLLHRRVVLSGFRLLQRAGLGYLVFLASPTAFLPPAPATDIPGGTVHWARTYSDSGREARATSPPAAGAVNQ